MTMTIFKADFNNAQNAAYAFLRASKTSSLPIKLKEASKVFPNVKIMTYSKFGKISNMTFEEVCDFANSDEGCCYFKRSSKTYLILYNDSLPNEGRKRWTIAHELGHFMLRHNEKSNRSILSRSTISSVEYEELEKEANCFARNILAPTKVLYEIGKFDAADIVKWCNVSKQAAINILKNFNKALTNGAIRRKQDAILQMFSDFIHKTIHEHFCRKCKAIFFAYSPSHCPVCSENKISRKLGDDRMIYVGYSLDADGRAETCPQCENEMIHPDGDFCPVCGVTIVNKCTGTFYAHEYDHDGTPCNTPAEGYARYCYKCGNPTTYYTNNLLKDWNKEKNTQNVLLNRTRGALPVVISDDDLPF
ncbi:ImmA/IrrE family metallo-endopeptidase [Cohnella sp. GCM10020058]|uniref:ImmA/IrrE family metallo-endopeptidase n=1 Tax=Cohnella sp. GCM10020058 TaxID=3317330 RepID=UPI00362A0A4B